MITIYVYILDTLADWELAHITSELNSKRFFKNDAPNILLKTVSYSQKSICTMGGLTIVPDCTIDEMIVDKSNVLLLPGADTWNDPKHNVIIAKADEFLSKGAIVGAICGATLALADIGVLDNRPHTSNAMEFLEMFSQNYSGKDFYVNEPVVAKNNLITASAAGSVLFAKKIIEHLGVFREDTLELWYKYFTTGNPEYFFGMMETLRKNNEN